MKIALQDSIWISFNYNVEYVQLGPTWESSNALYLSKEKSISQFCSVGSFWRNYFFSSAKGKGEWSFGGGRVKKKIGLKRHWLWALEPQRTRFLLPRLEHWGLNLSTNLMQISTDSLCILPPGRVKHISGNASKLNVFSSRCMFTSCTQCLPSPSAPQSTWPWLSQWRGLKIKSYQFGYLDLYDPGSNNGEDWNWILIIWLKSKDH